MSQAIPLAVCLVVFAISFATMIGDVVKRTRTTITLRVGKHDYEITGRTTTDEVAAIFEKEFLDRPKQARRKLS